jgi:hypothetical protein
LSRPIAICTGETSLAYAAIATKSTSFVREKKLPVFMPKLLRPATKTAGIIPGTLYIFPIPFRSDGFGRMWQNFETGWGRELAWFDPCHAAGCTRK